MLRVVIAFVVAAGLATSLRAAEQCSKCNKEMKTSIAAKQSISAKQSVEDRFKEMDVKGDGKVTLDEYKDFVKKHVKDQSKLDQAMKHAEKRFKAIDTNSDGVITLDELKAAPPEHHKKKKDQ